MKRSEFLKNMFGVGLFSIVPGFVKKSEAKNITLEEKSDEKITKTLLGNGRIEYRNEEGWLHNINDLPAAIHGDFKAWYKNGLLHRDGDKSAIETKERKAWYKNGHLHRENDKPAEIYSGSEDDIAFEKYLINGFFHRKNGPAYIEHDINKKITYQEWWSHGMLEKSEFSI